MVHRWLLGLALCTAVAGSAFADSVKFHAVLAATSEVPPTKSTGSGQASATLDTDNHTLTYDVTFGGFATTVTMAHFHGPAPEGKNAGVQVPLGEAPTSPIHGTVTLTPEQQKQLVAGQWYVNVHTSNSPKGAIRGQMLPSQ